MQQIKNTNTQNELQNVIKKQMAYALQNNEADVNDMVFLSYILSKMETEEETLVIIDLMKKRYPFLENVVEDISQKEHEHELRIIKTALEKIIQKDPKTAALVAAELTKPDVSLEAIIKKYPQIKSYL